MAGDLIRIDSVRPKVRRRECGGWLAVCPYSAGLSFGVTGATEQEAKEQFRFELGRWLDILKQKTLDVPKQVS
jgi:hypothetical protein